MAEMMETKFTDEYLTTLSGWDWAEFLREQP